MHSHEPNHIQIRQATLADLAVLSILFDHYRQFYGYSADPVMAERFIGERLAGGDSQLFIADAGGIAVGFAQCYPGFASLECRPSWLLSDLFVEPDQRQQGIGQQLLGATRKAAEGAGCALVELFTAKTNTGAQKLYEANGYEADRQFIHYELFL